MCSPKGTIQKVYPTTVAALQTINLQQTRADAVKKNKVFVGGLPSGCTEQNLRDVFHIYGEVPPLIPI